MPEQIVIRLNAALEGRYRVERELGEGGMATVYLAEDLRHGRKVAVKVLRSDLAAALGPERFLREIEVAAQLTHPHILPLHDSGEADGFLYYVMPYIEGESLRARIDREGELPVADAVRILRQVSDALASAHKRGVVHRDVKPDNVLLADGHAMVADFGVAKAVSEAPGSRGLTTAGMALGTPAYMSPEQAAGSSDIDHRSDIYALGAMGYELLAGHPPFAGMTTQALLAAHLTADPDPVTDHRAATPAVLGRVIMTCLAKKPADRWQSAEDVLRQLESIGTPGGGVTPTTVAPTPTVAPRRGPWILAVALVAVAVLGVWGWVVLDRAGPTIETSNIRQLTRTPGLEFDPAISPDGGEVAYAVRSGSDVDIYVRDVEGGRPIPLTADLPGQQTRPRWTPDGRSVAFLSSGSGWQLVPRFGGTPRSYPWEATFRGDRMLFLGGPDSLYVGPADGSSRTFAGSLDPGAHSLAWSPDGERLAYVTGNSFYIQVGNLGNIAPSTVWTQVIEEGSEPVRVTDSESLNAAPVWLPDSRSLLFVSDREGPRDLYAVGLDRSGRPRGPPVRLTTGLSAHSVSLSADGTTAAYSRLIYRTNVWAVPLPESGTADLSQGRPITRGNQTIEAHDVSADAEWLAYDSNLDGPQDIYVRRLGEAEPRRVTTHPGYDFHPSFAPDGREIVFHSTRHGSRDLFLIGADGENERRLTADPGEEMNPEFSPDGLRIAYRDRQTPGIFVLERDSIGAPWSEPRQVASVAPNISWSPDGRHLAFSTGGRVGLIPMDGELRILLDDSEGGLTGPGQTVWSEDGRRIYFEAVAEDGAAGFYGISVEGGTPEMIVRFDDPSLSVQFSPSLRDGVLYLSVAEHESDIYVMDLAIR